MVFSFGLRLEGLGSAVGGFDLSLEREVASIMRWQVKNLLTKFGCEDKARSLNEQTDVLSSAVALPAVDDSFLNDFFFDMPLEEYNKN